MSVVTWVRSVAGRLVPARAKQADGYVATILAICLATGLFMGAAAIAVDTARWYAEMEEIQKAADAAATAGVPYLPYDFAEASVAAKKAAALNGFPESADTSVTVKLGGLDSQLRVTITTRVKNSFGASFGVADTHVTRTAMADYKAAAPMGSPCNTFGNEPDGGGTTKALKPTASSITGSFRLPTNSSGVVLDPTAVGCSSNPQMWAAIEGPSTTKGSGDRFMNKTCDSGVTTYGCDSTKKVNLEYDETGYFWMITVGPKALNQPISVQAYDPGYVFTGQTCASLNPPSTNTPNDYVSDGLKRYTKNSTSQGVNKTGFCPGDYVPGSPGSAKPPVTSFVVRGATESLDPMQGVPITGCTMQVNPWATGSSAYGAPSANNITKGNSAYNDQLAQTFHQWYEICTFTPAVAGDYYVQVRTNVKFGGTTVPNSNGTSIISRANPAVTAKQGNDTSTWGVNSFALRAVSRSNAQSETVSPLQQYVSVSAYERMPMFASSTSSATSTFHLIRVLPGSAGQKIQFEFFDVSDGNSSTSGTIKVLPPKDASGTIETVPFPGGCTSNGGSYSKETLLSGCSAAVSSGKNNAQLGTILIPIPSDYDCDYAKATGCWYKVQVALNGQVNDITTWKATVLGDPVRLIE